MGTCFQCGKLVDDDARFCPHCGAPAAQHDQQTDSPVQPQSPQNFGQPVMPIESMGGQPTPYDSMQGGNQKGSAKATISLVLGILSILFVSLLFGIIAIVLSNQYVKKFGRDGKATAGKVCGIVGTVLSCLAIVVLIAGYAFIGGVDSYESASINGASSTFDATADSVNHGSSAPDETVADSDGVAVAQASIDRLKNPDEAMVKAMAKDIDREFKTRYECSYTEMGGDPAELARWIAGTVQCELDPSDVFVNLAYDDPCAFADTYCVSLGQLLGSVSEQVLAHDGQPDATALYGFIEAAKTSAEPSNYFLCFDMERQGDGFVVEEESFLEEAEFVYDMYNAFGALSK